MLAASLLIKKRRGENLSDEEIRFLIDGFCDGSVADYQMSALAMAICLRGMTSRETATLTHAMLQSGDQLPRVQSNHGDRPRLDKHSTGGLGDKVSLILAPMLAVCGIDVPMISGRGLGLTGGTLDKLEAIEGFQTQLSIDESSAVLKQVGAFIVGASERIAPADRKLYALRDVTGTVDSVPLITGSILSKKLAANIDALVMDVKVGQGAFMQTVDDALELSESLIRVGEAAGLPTSVIMSDMDQPLGAAVGNAIEVNESIDVLQGSGPIEVRELSIELAANLLIDAKLCADRAQAINKLSDTLQDGSAFEKFNQMVSAQGGVIDGELPLSTRHDVVARESGFVDSVDCIAIGNTVVAMGGGRQRVEDIIDPSVGVHVHARIGDRIEKGQCLVSAYTEDAQHLNRLESAISISPNKVPPRPLILKRLDQKDFPNIDE